MKVAVIGGGIVGLSVAYFLADRGVSVTLVERDRCGAATSRGNTGWITPGISSVPLAAPGVVGQGLRWMLKPDSPLYIRPRPSPELARWLWRFWRSSGSTAFETALRSLVRLNLRTLEIFDRFRSDGVRFEMHHDGLLYLCRSHEHVSEVRDLYSALTRAGYQGPHRMVAAGEIRALEPALASGVVGGVYSEGDRHVRPESLTAGLSSYLRNAGVEVREQARVRRLEPVRRGWHVITDSDAVDADAVVVAAGLWSKDLLKALGVRLPLLAGKGYSITARGEGTVPRRPLYLSEARVGVSPLDGNVVRVGGTLELTGADLTVRRRRLEPLLRAAGEYLQDWRPTTVELEWAGLRPFVPDSLPVVGPVPGFEGLYVATGHGMVGMTVGPPSALELATAILDREVPEVLRPFAPGRLL